MALVARGLCLFEEKLSLIGEALIRRDYCGDIFSRAASWGGRGARIVSGARRSSPSTLSRIFRRKRVSVVFVQKKVLFVVVLMSVGLGREEETSTKTSSHSVPPLAAHDRRRGTFL
jgi:hypothetical protein